MAPPRQSSCYPIHPNESQVLVRVSGTDFGFIDRLLVYGSSLFIVASPIWVPTTLTWCYRRLRQNENLDRNRRKIYTAFIIAFLGLMITPRRPLQSPSFGRFIRIRSWSLWKAWLRFVAFEAILDKQSKTDISNLRNEKNIMAFCPHGIFPFAFGLGVLPETAQKAFGVFRPVVATAVWAFPIVGTIIRWLDGIDASREVLDRVMASEDRVGIIPGGIAEIFESYPKRGIHPDEECAIVRKGILRMAIEHGRAIVPIYCFGSTKMFRLLQLPILERLSNLLRISLCVFYGVLGLPLPFRQRLLYIMGEPIPPPQIEGADLDTRVDEMYRQFCGSLHSMFDRHKSGYGWGHKSLKIIPSGSPSILCCKTLALACVHIQRRPANKGIVYAQTRNADSVEDF